MSCVVITEAHPLMDKPRDVTSRHPNKPFSSSAGDVLSSERTSKERFQRLSLVGRAATSSCPSKEKPMDPTQASHREEEVPGIRPVVGRKRLKLPRKFLEDCKSSVPRKLRSGRVYSCVLVNVFCGASPEDNLLRSFPPFSFRVFFPTKKRSRESLSPVLDSKKLKLSIRGESLKRDSAKKTKRKGKLHPCFPGPITKDEEEVVETLSALAGMFLNNNDECNCIRANKECSPADASAAPGGAESSTHYASQEKVEELQVLNSQERPSEQTESTRSLDGPITRQSPALHDCKLFSHEQDEASRDRIDLQMISSQSRSEKSSEELQESFNFVPTAPQGLDVHFNKPGKLDILFPPRKQEDEEVKVPFNGNLLVHRNNGLSTMSLPQGARGLAELPASKIPPWLQNATISRNCRQTENPFPTEKLSKELRKRCMKHVHICHLIRSLEMPKNEGLPMLQPNLRRQHEETERRAHTVGPNFNIREDGTNQTLGSTRFSDSQRNPQPSKSILSENKGFDFLSLSTSGTSLHPKSNVSYNSSITKQSVPLPLSKNYYSNSNLDQLSGVALPQQVQLQLPSYIRNPGNSMLFHGPMVQQKEQQHRHVLWTGPMASSQYKPGQNLKAVVQFPTWQNGNVDSPTMVPFDAIAPHPPFSFEQLGHRPALLSRQHHHHQPQQQQLVSLCSFPLALGKRQDSFPQAHSAQEQTVPMFHGAGALSL